jgi:transcriptional regulator with XRE-family HTH domain
MELTRDAQTLKAIRALRGLSQRKLAEKLRVSPALISYIENGHKRITEDLKIKLAVHFPLDDELRSAIASVRRADELLQ